MFKKSTNPKYHISKTHLISKRRKKRENNISLQPLGNKTSVKSNECESSDTDSDDFSRLVNTVSSKKCKYVTAFSSSDSEDDIVLNKKEKLCEESLPDFSEGNTSDGESNSSVGELEDENEDAVDSTLDPFNSHFQYDLSEELLEAVSSNPPCVEEHCRTWPVLGQLKVVLPKPRQDCGSKQEKRENLIQSEKEQQFAKPGKIPAAINSIDWSKLHVKSQIQNNILKGNIAHVCEDIKPDQILTPLQKELFSIINMYQDVYFANQNLENGEEVRFVYCLHIINHVLKTRLKVTHHNARLSQQGSNVTDVPDDYRDQGLVRPKVVILVPFRSSALRVVQMLSSILLSDENRGNIINKKRFFDEFTGSEIAMPYKNPKPEDYEKTFSGNTDDNFRIGLSVTKKSLKLFADFYSSDIIIASPLGLRVIVGAEGEAERDFDFLASIEIVVLDQAEIFLMQNWDHVLHTLDHFHLQPKQPHGTNFARVRSWTLNGWSHYYRQTLVFTAYPLPQISALVNRKCRNYAGKVCIINPVLSGTISQVVLQLPQVFHKFDAGSAVESADARFKFFITKILPQYKDSIMSHTLIYVPVYFDYVRLRNYFKKETVSFVQICEYSKEGKIARARDMFFHGDAHFMLYSERFHFFRRIRIKGIHHILFYQPPTVPHFYSELCNLMQSALSKGDENTELNMTVNVVYSKYDAPQLAAVVGSERAARMLTSDRHVHMFMTGD